MVRFRPDDSLSYWGLQYPIFQKALMEKIMQTTPEEKLIVYGHNYCAQAFTLARTLKKHGIAHEWRDVKGNNPHFKEELRELANGNLSVPTVIFPDGTVMVEPPNRIVLETLGYKTGSDKKGLGRLLRKIFG